MDILEFHRGKRCCEPWPAPEPKTNGFHKRRPTASFSLSAESVENVETSEAHLPRHRVLEKGSSRWMSTCYLRMEVKDGKDQALNFSFCIPNPPKKKNLKDPRKIHCSPSLRFSNTCSFKFRIDLFRQLPGQCTMNLQRNPYILSAHVLPGDATKTPKSQRDSLVS